MAAVIITPNPETPDETLVEDEVTWESALLEVKTELQSGFSLLRNSLQEMFQAELSTLRQSNTDLSQMVVTLTSQITDNNRTLMEKLTPTQPALVVVETPPSDTPNPDVDVTALSEVTSDDLAPPARRKRRTL